MKTIYPLSSSVTLEVASGDISNQGDLDAVVLFLSSRPRFVKEPSQKSEASKEQLSSEHLSKIQPGQAVISTLFDAKSPLVITCLAPLFGVDLPSNKLLANCYKNAIALAEGESAKSIGFSGISGPGFYYPVETAALTAIGLIRDLAPDFQSLSTIRFLLPDSFSLGIYRDACNHILGLIT